MQQQATFVSTDKPQPPRPESRSDSFIRADALLREHRQQQQQLATSNSVGNHTDQKQDYGRNSRPESRNRTIAYQSYDRTTITGNDRNVDHMDAGLLAVVDQQSSGQNNADPLVSLIQSLAEISPVRSPSSVTNKTANDHHSPSNSAATATTASNNVANTITNCSPNQSPKAWQNCTQVCPPSSRDYPHRIQFCTLVLFILVPVHSDCTKYRNIDFCW